MLREARREDARAVTTLMADAFAADPTDPETMPWSDEPSLVRRVAERTGDGRLLATASARLCGQWFGGARVPGAALSGVAVDLTARGCGIGRALVQDIFDELRRAGAALVTLIPSTHAFYRRTGCGIGGRRTVLAVTTAELRALARTGPSLTFRPALSADLPAVSSLVRARAERGNGGLDHPGDVGGPLQFVAERSGRVVGWCALARSVVPGGFVVVVLDLVGADPAAELTIWRDLVADPGARKIHALIPPGGLLEHHLPRRSEPVEDASWMIALLDLSKALTARGYPPGVRARIGLRVTGHTGVVVLEAADGRATAQPLDQMPPAITTAELTGPDLASIYAGHLDPVAARHHGLLSCSEPTALLLRALFAGPAAVLYRPF